MRSNTNEYYITNIIMYNVFTIHIYSENVRAISREKLRYEIFIQTVPPLATLKLKAGVESINKIRESVRIVYCRTSVAQELS